MIIVGIMKSFPVAMAAATAVVAIILLAPTCTDATDTEIMSNVQNLQQEFDEEGSQHAHHGGIRGGAFPKVHSMIPPVRQLLQRVQKTELKSSHPISSPFEKERDLQQCDFCGSQGSCGRTTRLGDLFEVTVEDAELGSSWIVSCLFPNRDDPSCYYVPGGVENIYSFQDTMDFAQATASCPSECCNWVYPRSKRANLPVRGGDDTCDGETTCREISQVCRLQGQSKTKTFSCPVGTMMQIEGGSGGGSKLTVGAGAQLVASPGECTITTDSNTLVCPSITVGQGGSMSAIVAADDCNCVTCDASGTNLVEEGLCSTPIPSYLHGEGICAPIYDNFCPPPIDRADGGDGGVIIGSQLNEQDQMKMYHSEIKTALDALEVAIQQGTLTPGERIGHVEAMKTGLANLEAAIQNARVYQIGAEESVLGMIDDMQGMMHLVQCFVSWGCMTTDGVLLLLDTEKATLAQIEANFGSYNENRSTGNNGDEGKKTDALSEFQRASDLLTDIRASIRFLELGIVHTGHSATEMLPLFDPLNTHLAALHNELATAVNYKPGESLGPILGWILRTETDLPDLKCGLEGTCTITHDKMVDLVETAMLSVNLIGHYMVPPPES